MNSFLASTFLDELPWEVAIIPGLVLFAVSLLFPRRIVSLPTEGSRRRTLLWAGTIGPCIVVVVASITSTMNLLIFDASGFDGWWRRPAPLIAAVMALMITAWILNKEPVPAPGQRAIAPRRRWFAFTSTPLLWGTGITGTLLVVTTLWQIMIATSAPESGPFVGRILEYTSLPIFMSFNGSNGYAPGAGWPNHLATFLAVVLACVALFTVSRADANRPIPVRASVRMIRMHRESAARLMGLIVFAGLITTLGAVWMHTGLSGQTLVGYDQQWVSDDVSYPTTYIGGSYSGIAREMNLTGYLLQGVGVALALRTAVDTARAYRSGARKNSLPEPSADGNVSISGATQ